MHTIIISSLTPHPASAIKTLSANYEHWKMLRLSVPATSLSLSIWCCVLSLSLSLCLFAIDAQLSMCWWEIQQTNTNTVWNCLLNWRKTLLLFFVLFITYWFNNFLQSMFIIEILLFYNYGNNNYYYFYFGQTNRLCGGFIIAHASGLLTIYIFKEVAKWLYIAT